MTLTARELERQIPDAKGLLSDEPEIKSSLHYVQLMVLVSSLEWLWRDRSNFFIGANLTIYFSPEELKKREFRGPDFFLVKEVEKLPRNSWTVWEEDGRYPDLIIELLPESTAEIDRTLKKELYQDRFHTLEYFWFSPNSQEFAGFRLTDTKYVPIDSSAYSRKWSESLQLYLDLGRRQLRFFTPQETLVPTPEEVVGRLSDRLRTLGIDLEEM